MRNCWQLFFFSACWAQEQLHNPLKIKRFLFINSYHAGYEWSDGIEKGLEAGLKGKKIELEKFYMDTKRNREPEAINSAADMARQKIAAFKPDIVITADDNAAKHVIAPHYKDA